MQIMCYKVIAPKLIFVSELSCKDNIVYMHNLSVPIFVIINLVIK